MAVWKGGGGGVCLGSDAGRVWGRRCDGHPLPSQHSVTRPVTRVGCREKNTVQYSTEIHTGMYLALHKI